MSVSFALAQQGRGKFNPQEFKAKLESYVTRKHKHSTPSTSR